MGDDTTGGRHEVLTRTLLTNRLYKIRRHYPGLVDGQVSRLSTEDNSEKRPLALRLPCATTSEQDELTLSCGCGIWANSYGVRPEKGGNAVGLVRYLS